MDEKQYQEALDYLYSFIDFSLTRNLRYSEEKFDLSRMTKLMDLIDNPQNDYDVIHVAGTKGKGSTCVMIASILIAQGYRVGLYSSPHMIDFTERIQIDNVQISPGEFVEFLGIMRSDIENVSNISTFEITTALALKYFSKKEVDIAVVEVGMGGRLDATNIVNPLLTVITSISLDHTKILGDTISKIAYEKAGIIKKDIPVVIGNQTQEAREVILGVAEQKESPIIDVFNEYNWEQKAYSLEGQQFQINLQNQAVHRSFNFHLKLLGDHQLDNATTAYAVINHLPQRYEITEKAVQIGFQKTHWPGRFEILHEEPLIIVDGAHNPDSFEKLSQTIEKYLKAKRITLIFGASEDKDIRKMIEFILPYVDSIIFTKSDHPRAMTEKEIRNRLSTMVTGSFRFCDIEELIDEMMANKNGTYIASGSLFIAGAVKEILQSKGINDPKRTPAYQSSGSGASLL
jgi:dihydrofolate synthase / folylpolyglutamate synthase